MPHFSVPIGNFPILSTSKKTRRKALHFAGLFRIKKDPQATAGGRGLKPGCTREAGSRARRPPPPPFVVGDKPTPPHCPHPLGSSAPLRGGKQTHSDAGAGGSSGTPAGGRGPACPSAGRRLAYRALWRGLRLRARGTRLTAGQRLSGAEGRERPAGRPKEQEARSKRGITTSLRGNSAGLFLCVPLRFRGAGHRAAAAPSLVRTEVFPAAAFAAGRARPVALVSRPAGKPPYGRQEARLRARRVL